MGFQNRFSGLFVYFENCEARLDGIESHRSQRRGMRSLLRFKNLQSPKSSGKSYFQPIAIAHLLRSYVQLSQKTIKKYEIGSRFLLYKNMLAWPHQKSGTMEL